MHLVHGARRRGARGCSTGLADRLADLDRVVERVDGAVRLEGGLLDLERLRLLSQRSRLRLAGVPLDRFLAGLLDLGRGGLPSRCFLLGLPLAGGLVPGDLLLALLGLPLGLLALLLGLLLAG